VRLKENLRTHLDKQGITAAQLAKRAGVSKQVLSTWLNGASPRKIEQVKKVADSLSVSVDELCFGSKMPTAQDQFPFPSDQWISGVFEIKVRKVK